MRALIEEPGDLGFLIRRIRESHGLNQRQLATRLAISQRYLSELESGKPKRIDAHYLSVLAALGIALTAEVEDERRG